LYRQKQQKGDAVTKRVYVLHKKKGRPKLNVELENDVHKKEENQ